MILFETFFFFFFSFLILAMGESEAAEETVSGGQEEGGYSPESSQALVGPSPQGCSCHPADRPGIPPSQAP